MRVVFLILVVLSLAGPALAQDRDFSANGEFFRGVYSSAKAMEMVYRSYDSKSISSIWTPRQGHLYKQSWPDQIRVHTLRDFPYVEGGVQRHLLVTWAKPDETEEEYSCHACGVLLGIVALKKTEGGWKVEESDLQLAISGVSGQPPSVRLVELGRSAFGLAIETSDIHQGEVERGLSIYGPLFGGFTEWFNTELEDLDPDHEYDEMCRGLNEAEMNGICVSYRTTYLMVPRHGDDEMYDLLLRKRVVRSFSKKAPLGTSVQRFRFDGAKYVALKQPD